MIGSIIIAGVVGKVVSSVKKADEAGRIFDRAGEAYQYAYRAYLRDQRRTMQIVNDLTQWQIMTADNEISRFVTTFGKIKDIDYQEVSFGDRKQATEIQPDMKFLQFAVGSVSSFVKDNLFLGMVLAGVPMAMRAEKLMNDAITARNLTEAGILKLEDEMEELYIIRCATAALHEFLRRLLRACRGPLAAMEKIVEGKQNWKTFTQEEKVVVGVVVKLMQLIKTLISARVVKDDGHMNPDIATLLGDEAFTDELEAQEEKARAALEAYEEGV